MKISDFFDNLNVYFNDDEGSEELEDSSQIYSFAYKNDSGDIYEVRLFNPEYKEIMSISRDGKIDIVSVDE